MHPAVSRYTPDPNQVIEVVVEAWQNQRYKHIIRDWTIGEEFLFSDITGNVEIQFETDPKELSGKSASEVKKNTERGNNAIPIASLPSAGWEWVGEWKIDMFDTFGLKDSEGWSYSTSFDTLRKNSVFRCLEANVERTSVFRRRRWVRSRVCTSVVARELFMAEKLQADKINARIGEIVVITEHNCDQLNEFENVRKAKINEVSLETDKVLAENIQCLRGLLHKLNQLKDYLLERSSIEQSYSSQLKKLSDKWMSQKETSPHPPSPPPPLSSEISSNYPELNNSNNNNSNNNNNNNNNDNNNNEHEKKVSFFDIVCTASSIVSEKLSHFSFLLSSALYNDVNSIISELDSVLSDCEVVEAPTLKFNLTKCLESVETKYKLCDSILKQSRAFNMAQKQFTSQTLFNKCASEVVNNDIDESDLYRCICPFTDLRKNRFVYLIRDILENISKSKSKESSGKDENRSFFRRTSFSSSSSSSPSASFVNIDELVDFSNSNNFLAESALYCNLPYTGFDAWSALQSYRQNVVESEANFFVYQAFVIQQSKYTNDIMSKVSDLLQQALKLFADQHVSMWQEAGELFSSVINDTKTRLRGNSEHLRDSDCDSFADSNNSSNNNSLHNTPTKELKSLQDSISSPEGGGTFNNNDSSSGSSGGGSGGGGNAQDTGDSWQSSTLLDKFNASQYIMKASKIKFSLFPSADGGKRNSYSSRNSLSAGSLQGYDIPRPSITDDEVDDSDPHSWQQGLLVVTLDGIAHILHASSDLGASSVFEILDGNCVWTAHAPLMSCEITKLKTEPSLVLFPGVEGDALIIKYNAEYISKSLKSETETSAIKGESLPRGVKFMNCFVRDCCPLAIVVDSSEEVKSWIRVFLNPFGI